MTLSLARHLDRTGISQTELAERTDTTRGYISLLINNHRKPSPAMLEKLAKIFGVDIADLFEASQPPGMSDQARRFEPANAHQRAFRDALQVGRKAVEIYTLRTDAPALSLCADDLLALDLARTATSGDLVIATRTDEAGNGATFVARWLDPWLISGDITAGAERIDDDGTLAILGVISAVLRTNPTRISRA